MHTPELFDSGDLFNLAPLTTGDGAQMLADRLAREAAERDLEARQAAFAYHDTAVNSAISRARLTHARGMNESCIIAREYQTRAGNWFRVEAHRADVTRAVVYSGYKLTEGKWVKVPCWTDAEERAYPKTLAKLGSCLVKALQQQYKAFA